MNFLRQSLRFITFASILGVVVWGTGCQKKTKTPDKTPGNKTTPDAKSPADAGKTGGSMTSSTGSKTTPADTTKTKRKVNEVPPPPKVNESGSGTKKSKLRKVNG